MDGIEFELPIKWTLATAIPKRRANLLRVTLLAMAEFAIDLPEAGIVANLRLLEYNPAKGTKYPVSIAIRRAVKGIDIYDKELLDQELNQMVARQHFILEGIIITFLQADGFMEE